MTETTRKDIEPGSCRNAENLFAKLDRRLAKDDANPSDGFPLFADIGERRTVPLQAGVFVSK